MDRLSRPRPARRTTFLPGLLFGILLALIQFLFFTKGHTIPLLLFGFLCYLAIPALSALLVTRWTRQPFAGYKAGMLTGVSCAVVLVLALLIYLSFASAEANSGLGAGAIMSVLIAQAFTLPVAYNVVGVILALLGALLGSAKWKRGA